MSHDSENATVRNEREGVVAGEPIILVHGWPLSGLTYRKIIPRLADRYTCFAVDLAGAGESTWQGDNDFSFHGHAGNLARWVRESSSIPKYPIIARPWSRPFKRQRPCQVWLAFKTMLRSKAFLRSNGGFGGCFVDKSNIDEDFIAHFVTALIESNKKLEGQMRYVRGIDWRQLDALAMDHGRITAPRARLMVHQLPRCTGLIVVPGTKLLPHEEKPVVVADHIRAFFAGSSPLN